MDCEQRISFLCQAFQSFLENSPDMVFVKDTNLVYWAASPSFAQMMGYRTGADLVGKTDFEIFEEGLARKYTEDDRAILASGVNIEGYIEPLPDQNGEKNYSSTSKYLIRDESGTVLGLYGVARDVTAEVELEAERETSRLSRQMFDSVLEADLTENRMMRKEGDGWLERFQLDSDTVFEEAARRFSEQFVHPDYQKAFSSYYDLECLRQNYGKGVDEFRHVSCLRVQEKEYRWIEFSSRVYHSRVTNTLRLTTFLKDVDEDVRRREQLQRRAATDMLTGLSNRETFLERVTARIGRDTGEQSYALMFIDLDSFKQVNDIWGHQLGDKVLQKTAERLRKLFPGDEIVGRFGGDEFLVFLRWDAGRNALEEQAKKVLEMLHFHHVEYNIDIYVTCSVGVALCKSGELTVEQLCERADKAMYQAKEHGRNQVFFDED